VRTRFVAFPGRIVNRSGRLRLRAPKDWPWAARYLASLAALRALDPATG
jgi:hypothetical protein